MAGNEDDPRRIRGWKAIASYLGCERTTAMRWSAERGLPIHRIPGGKQATVFALKAELDVWIASHRTETDIPVSPGTPQAEEVGRIGASIWMRRAVLGAIMLLLPALALVVPTYWSQPSGASSARQAQEDAVGVPADPALAETYLEARRQWAQRKPDSLGRARDGLIAVTRSDPGFAPAWAALAEVWLLEREYGNVSDLQAFAEAENAARTALAIDDGLWTAHRALGFVQYWLRHDPVGAGRSFRRALELAPGDPQTHFWYANILSDNGQAEKAATHFSTALALNPSSVPLQVDHGWAQWEAGNDARADAIFAELLDSAPDNAVLHACLADIAVMRGDWPGYARHFAEYALLRGDPASVTQAQALREAALRGPRAIGETALHAALEDATGNAARNHDWAAAVASALGDRARLVTILRTAQARRERWGTAGYRRRIAQRWQGDAEILRLLEALKMPPII